MSGNSRASKILRLVHSEAPSSSKTVVKASSVRRSRRLNNSKNVSEHLDGGHGGTTEHEEPVSTEHELPLSQSDQLFPQAEQTRATLEDNTQPLMSSAVTSSSQIGIFKIPTDKSLEISDAVSDVYVSSSESYVPSPNKSSSFDSSINISNEEANSILNVDHVPITTDIVESSSSDDDINIFTVKKINGKRKRNKKHCCFFCNKLLSNNMARHFETVHKNETDVARVLALPKNSNARRKRFGDLIRNGDFYYNCNILTIKKGKLILVRRPDKKCGFSYNDFVPCHNCLGFMAKKYIWHHLKHSCVEKKMVANNGGCKSAPLNESAALLFQSLGHNFPEAFQREIVSSFRLDEVSHACKGDDLILKLGAFMFEKYGTKQLELIRQTMRQLGRFKLEFQKIHETPTLSSVLTPGNFDNVVAATKNLCRTWVNDDVSLDFKIPSLALKIGHHLRKCVAIERGTALRNGNMKRAEELRNFLELITDEWSTKISSNALQSLHKKKLSATQLLPLTSDLIKLNSYLTEEVKLLTEKVLSSCNAKLWANLASVTLCRTILFNKRRSGEASRMTLENYSTRPSWSEQTTSEFKESLSPVEKQLANRLVVVQIIGKRNRIVPVLLPADIKVAVDSLIKTRENGEISSTNPYVFATSSTTSRSNRYLFGHKCLRKVCDNAGLECAKNITSTKLRKYMATVCQIFDLKEHECDWLARHLGHDITVHRDFYRMHESAIELTKVSRLLLAVESGKANKFAGRQLHDINIEEMSDIEEDQDVLEDKDGEEKGDDDFLMDNEPENSSDFDNDVPDESEDRASPLKTSAKEQCKRRKLDRCDKQIARKKASVHSPWSSDALASVTKFFSRDIKNKRVPGKQACEECIEKSGNALKNRKWTDVKFCVKNIIARQSRMRAI